MRRLALAFSIGLALLPGCSGLLRSYETGPEGLSRPDAELRRALREGRSDSLLVQRLLAGEHAPGDELLRALYGGLAAFHAGRYEESGRLLDVASVLADERATKSITRSALSLVTSDRVLPYEPSPTERLLIPFYGAQAYLRLEDRTGAAVEARRLSGLLERYQDDVGPETASLHAALRYFAGAVFELAGESNDAAVAYRHAGGLPGLDTIAPLIPADSGDVVLFLEHGFVAHRVEESLNLLLAAHDVYGLRTGPDHDRFGLAALISERVLARAADHGDLPRGPLLVDALPAQDEERPCALAGAGPGPEAGPTGADSSHAGTILPVVATDAPAGCRPRGRHDHVDEDEDEPYLLRVAWPTLRWTSRVPAAATLASATAAAPLGELVFADVSRAQARDFGAELPLIIARTVARGAAKAAITEGAERKLEEKHEGLGDLAGVLGNLGNVLLERADTRCWQLLPGALGVARVRLPAGAHELHVRLEDGAELALGAVTVAGGRARVLTARAW